MNELHARLIEELMSGKASLSPREHAAVNEIKALREKITKLEKPKRKTVKK